MSNSIAPGSSADVNIKVTALTTNPNVPVTYKTIILKKNLVNGVNTLTQEMMSTANTKYVIKYNYVLGDDITIPAGCILEFDGGSISANGSNDTINGVNTGISAGLVKILNTDVILAGSWNVVEAYPEWFGAKGDGIIECAAAINKTIQNFKGKIKLSTGRYIISETIILSNNTILEGNGSGPAFRTKSYGEVTAIEPSSSFQGDRVISADPKDYSLNAYYIYGCCIKNLAIDCINIANNTKTIIALMSVTNTDIFENIKVVNNNTNIALWIDESSNTNGMDPDGIIVSDFYCLSLDSEYKDLATLPLAIIGVCNEVSIRDSKFQRCGNPNISDSVALLINAKANGRTGKASNGITIDSCSFTEAEAGVKLVGNTTDANGPRYVRIVNCTWEYCKYPILTKSDSINDPVQFCNFGPGNRVNTIPSEGIHIKMESYSSNNVLYLTDNMKVECATENTSNIIIGGSEQSVINGNTNLWIRNDLGSIKLNHTSSWNNLTLGSGWINASPSNRNIAQYQLYNDKVNLRGYLTAGSFGYPNYIFTLPEGARPKKAYVINLDAENKLTVLDDGNCFITGSGTTISIDGVSFNIN